MGKMRFIGSSRNSNGCYEWIFSGAYWECKGAFVTVYMDMIFEFFCYSIYGHAIRV